MQRKCINIMCHPHYNYKCNKIQTLHIKKCFINAGLGGSLESGFEHMKWFGNWWHQRRHVGNNDSFTGQGSCESRNIKTNCLYIKGVAGQPLHQKLFHLLHIMQVPHTVHTSHVPHHMTHFFFRKTLYKVILCLNV